MAIVKWQDKKRIRTLSVSLVNVLATVRLLETAKKKFKVFTKKGDMELAPESFGAIGWKWWLSPASYFDVEELPEEEFKLTCEKFWEQQTSGAGALKDDQFTKDAINLFRTLTDAKSIKVSNDLLLKLTNGGMKIGPP